MATNKNSNTLSTYKTSKGNTVADLSSMTTAQVKALQTGLKKAGYNIGSSGVDGIAGKDTQAALAAWKKANGVNNTSGATIGQTNYNKLIGYTPTTTTKTTSGTSSLKSSGSSGSNSNYLVTAGQTGSYADLANMAQAYLTGGTYTPNQTIDTNYWSTAGGGGKNTLYNNTKDYAGKAFGTQDMEQIMKYANLYQQQQAYNQAYNQAKEDTTAMIEAEIAPYLQYYQNAQTESAAALQNSNQASKDAINNAYDNTARNYYQLYKTQQAKLPENMSLAGVTGGASESAQLNLLNTYANNLYNNESGRNTQLANVEQDYNDKVASNSISAANSIADAYLQLAQQKIAYDREDAQIAAEAQKTAEEEAAAKQLETYNANVRARMLKQLQKGDTIWSWTDDTGKLHWTTYKATAETYRSTYKVTELTTKDKDKVSSLGKKTNDDGGKKDDDPFGTGGDELSAAAKAVYQNALAAMYGNSTYGTKVGGQADAVAYIKKAAGKGGTITEEEASAVLKKLGLTT